MPKISGRHSFPPSTALARSRAEEYAGFVTCEGGCSYRSPNSVSSHGRPLHISLCGVPIRSPLRCYPLYNSWDRPHIVNALERNRFPNCGLSHWVSPHTRAQRPNQPNTPTRAMPASRTARCYWGEYMFKETRNGVR